ncbi:hypothetical protein RW64_06985 [Geobacter sulfurreducens]|nr:hypothetical protein RW64_06985 [Geobacter sulfurreducens]
MPHSDQMETPQRRGGRRMAMAVVAVLLLCLLILILVKLYLASPLATRHLSRLLSRTLGCPVTITALHTSGMGIAVRGIAIGNPAGFPAGVLAAADAVTVVPRWGALIRGERTLHRIILDGVRLTLVRDRSGTWNLARLATGMKGKKPAPDTRIGEVVVRRGSLAVEGHRMEGIDLNLRDLSTQGTTDSRLELAFADAAGNRFSLAGRGRMGARPAFDLTLSAPSITLASFSQRSSGRALDLAGAHGSLAVRAQLREGMIRIDGGGAVQNGVLMARGQRIPLGGNLQAAVSYDMQADRAVLDRLDLVLSDLVAARLTGTMEQVRRKGRFDARLTLDEVDLARLGRFLPASGTRIVTAGMLRTRGIRVVGDRARGVTSVDGAVTLSGGTIAMGARVVARDVDGTVSVSPAARGWRLSGQLLSPRTAGDVMVDGLRIPFEAEVSSHFKPTEARVAGMSCRVMGIPLEGGGRFRPTAAQPLQLSLRVPSSSLMLAATRLEPYGLRPERGTAALSLDLAGGVRGPFVGELAAAVNGAALSIKGKPATLGKGDLRARFAWRQGAASAAGTLLLDDASYGGRQGELAAPFRLDGRSLMLDAPRFRFGPSAGTARLVVVRLPDAPAGTVRPFTLEVTEGAVTHGTGGAGGINASIRGTYHGGTPGWPEVEGSGAAAHLTLQGKPIGAPSVRFTLGREKGEAVVGGHLLGGALSARIDFPARSPLEDLRFSGSLRQAKLAAIAPLMPATGRIPAVAGGEATISVDGGFAGGAGLRCGLEARASGIALDGAGGKRLLSGAEARVAARVAGERLDLREAVAVLGEGASVRIAGSMDRFRSPERTGTFSVTLPRTSLTSLVDPLINVLPRPVQEATLEGDVAVAAEVALAGKAGMVDGTATLSGVRLDFPSQKLNVSGIGGTIPFSLRTAAEAAKRPRQELSFSRENFARLQEMLRQQGPGDHTLTVGKIRFGPLELGETTLGLRAANGTLEISSLRSGLYEGQLLGRGFVAARGGIVYGGDILVYDLSLARLCDAVPKIRGYVSGRVDGLLSLHGQGAGMDGLTGFTDLWARESTRERMLLSREFLQRLAGKKLRGFFFRDDRPYDRGEVSAYLENGYLTFTTLDLAHTNIFGIKDLSVSVAPVQNRIALTHLFGAIKEAATRGKAVAGEPAPAEKPVEMEFQWRD